MEDRQSSEHAIKVRNWLHRSRSNVNWMAFGGVCRGTRAAIILSMLESQPSSGYTRWRACLHAHNKCVHGYACSWPSKVFTRDVVPCSCTAGTVYARTRLWIKDRGWRLQFRAGAGINTRSVNDIIISSIIRRRVLFLFPSRFYLRSYEISLFFF